MQPLTIATTSVGNICIVHGLHLKFANSGGRHPFKGCLLEKVWPALYSVQFITFLFEVNFIVCHTTNFLGVWLFIMIPSCHIPSGVID